MGKKHWNEPWNGGAEIRPGIPRLRGLAESLPVAAMIADPLGSPLVANGRFRELLGDPPAEGWLSLVEPGERASAESVWLLAGIARAMREVELGFVGTAGSFRATCRIAPIEEEGRVLGWAITLAELGPDLSGALEQAVAGLSEAEERLRAAEDRRLALEDRLAAAEIRQRDLEDAAAQAEFGRHEAEGMTEAAERHRLHLEQLLAVSEAARREVEDRLSEAETQLHGMADRLAQAEARWKKAETHLADVETARREVEDRLIAAEAARREAEERRVDSEAQRHALTGLLADSDARATEAEARIALADARLRESEERREAAEQALSLALADRDGALADRDDARALAEGWAEAAAHSEARLAEALAQAEAMRLSMAQAAAAASADPETASEADRASRSATRSEQDAEAAADEPSGSVHSMASGDDPRAGAPAAEPSQATEEHDEPADDVPDAEARFASDMSRAFAAMEQDHEAEEPELAGVVALGEAAELAMAGSAEGQEPAAEIVELTAPVPDWQLVAEAQRHAEADLLVAEPEAAETAPFPSPYEPEPADDASDARPAQEPELAAEAHGNALPAEVASEEATAATHAPEDTAQGEQAPPSWESGADDAAEVEAEAGAPSRLIFEAEANAGILEPDDGPELDLLAARLRSARLRTALGRWRAGRGRFGVPPFQVWDEASTEAGQVVIEMDEAGVPVRLRVVRSLEETPLLRALSAPPGGEGHGWRRCAASGRPAHDYAEVGLGPDGGHSLERLLLPFSTEGASVDRLVLLLVTEEVRQDEFAAVPLP